MNSRLEVHLKDRRLSAGLTQAELAGSIGVSRKTINTVENGVFVPSTVVALELARVLECRVEDLFALPDQTAAQKKRTAHGGHTP